jgi:hypothetical protein
MAYLNYKEGTGVRSRGDLSANHRPGRIDALDDAQLIKVADWLAVRATVSEPTILQPATCGKISDAILEVVNRGGESDAA